MRSTAAVKGAQSKIIPRPLRNTAQGARHTHWEARSEVRTWPDWL